MVNDRQDVEYDRKTHLDMWKHYDGLRQAKNSGFTTANSILVAMTGLFFKDARPVELILVSLLGALVCLSWFLLLTRNTAYIEYHRKEAGDGDANFWMPKTWTPRSKYLDRAPLGAFFLFWLGILVFSVVRIFR